MRKNEIKKEQNLRRMTSTTRDLKDTQDRKSLQKELEKTIVFIFEFFQDWVSLCSHCLS